MDPLSKRNIGYVLVMITIISLHMSGAVSLGAVAYMYSAAF